MRVAKPALPDQGASGYASARSGRATPNGTRRNTSPRWLSSTASTGASWPSAQPMTSSQGNGTSAPAPGESMWKPRSPVAPATRSHTQSTVRGDPASRSPLAVLTSISGAGSPWSFGSNSNRNPTRLSRSPFEPVGALAHTWPSCRSPAQTSRRRRFSRPSRSHAQPVTSEQVARPTSPSTALTRARSPDGAFVARTPISTGKYGSEWSSSAVSRSLVASPCRNAVPASTFPNAWTSTPPSPKTPSKSRRADAGVNLQKSASSADS